MGVAATWMDTCGLEIADTGVGVNQQIWKPMRGVVEVRYSPTEVS